MTELPDDANGTRVPPEDPASAEQRRESADRRVVYLILGGIFLAFLLGTAFLIFSAILDWQK